MSDLYLVHHGILGQKWGVRRYQNKDGSLTSAGKKRASEIALNIVKDERDYHRKKHIHYADESTRKYFDLYESIEGVYTEKQANKKRKEISRLADRADEEWSRYHTRDVKHALISGYIKQNRKLIPKKDASYREGEKYVNEMLTDKKYYSKFYDEHGKLR